MLRVVLSMQGDPTQEYPAMSNLAPSAFDKWANKTPFLGAPMVKPSGLAMLYM